VPRRRFADSSPVFAGRLAGVLEEVAVEVREVGETDFVADFRDGLVAVGDRLIGLLLGRTGVRPDWARIDRAERVLKRLLAMAPAGHRAGALTFLGWIAWYRGTSSAALVWFARAEQDSPGYRPAALLTRLIGHGELPEVSKDPGTAYHRC
jgi:hypothetical protein